MSTDLNDPSHPANTQPGLHESELNPLNRDNTNGMGAVGMAMGAFFGLEMFGDMTEAIGAGLDSGAFVEVGAMPAGSAFDGVNADLAAMQPAAPAPQAPQANINAQNPFMLPDRPGGMSGPG